MAEQELQENERNGLPKGFNGYLYYYLECRDPDYWDEMWKIRDLVNQELEILRKEKIIGSAQDAEIDFYADNVNFNRLAMPQEELRYFFKSSRADVHVLSKKPENAKQMGDSNIWIIIKASEHERCARCWDRRPEVSINREKTPIDMSGNKTGICYRCTDILNGKEEVRRFL